ncbi:OmpL47-type beta-barrel domain-containing protein [Microbacterium radiodurans]|uniref:Family 43 glycosylhydrolase n=1 Tax=Microbacterium radiodurans TaxID=661398 RepID=A0A5J5IMP5_9MICO|nr:family 43 glycosylhydrolase [Microbacterium radiodurans]KAA9084120.1 family 43 glycosylhydrolase [Microbacterium radiodurans]
MFRKVPRRASAALTAGAVVAGLVAAAPPLAAVALDNPILGDGSVYSADPATLVVDDTLYVYAGRDEADPTTNDFIMNEWQAFSTGDVAGGEWERHPSLMRPEQVFDWATPGRAYAGQVVEGADGRFYWYVPVHEAGSGSPDPFGIGVAVSDSPLGPWTDAVGGPIVSQEILGNDAHNIDPTVYVADDGRVWMYWGSFSRLFAIELGADMTSLVGESTAITSGVDGFFEAAWLFERAGTYYLAYAANTAGPDSWCTPAVYHACIAYSTAPGPLGPWTSQGRILAPVSSTTSHPAITEFQGEWYMAYHTADAAGGNHFRRSVAVDALQWDDSVSPARILPVVPTLGAEQVETPSANVAPRATASASNEPVPAQYWIAALNDGIVRPNPLPPDMWGSYDGDRAATEWIQYDWAEPVRIDRSSIQFWSDREPGSGDGVSAPRAWKLQYWVNGGWRDVAGASGYPTATRTPNEVTFTPVTTTRLRAVLDAAPGTGTTPRYSALAVEEWSVGAVAADGYDPAATRTAVGEAPELPETVALRYGDDRMPAPVRWDAVDPAAYAAPGAFTVSGVATGYAAARVEATVTVVDPSDTGEPDVSAPVLQLTARGAEGAGGWFVGPVTVRAEAADDRDVRSSIAVAVDGGAPTTTPDVRRVDTLLESDGTHTVSARATDAAGNVSAEQTVSVRIDRTAPTATGVVDASARTVTATATDIGSGLADLEYAIDEPTAWLTYGDPIPAPDLERHVVYLRATDAAGNTSMPVPVTIPRSPDAPLTGNIARFASVTASSASPWAPVDAVVDGAIDGASWGTWPRVGEQWVQLAWERPVDLDRAAVVFARDAADEQNAGLIPPRSWVLQYRDTSGAWRDVETDDAYGRSTTERNEVRFAALETTALRALMQSWGSAEGQGSAAMHEFEAWAAEAPEPVDTTAPTLTFDTAAAAPASGWFREGVRFEADAQDDADAAPAVRVRVDGGVWQQLSDDVEVAADGIHLVEAEGVDAAGNVSTRAAVTVRIDTIAPEVSGSVSEDDAGFLVDLQATDAGSGVGDVEVRSGDTWVAVRGGELRVAADGAVQLPLGGGVRLPRGGGAVDVVFRATDIAGNVSAERSLRVETGPTVPDQPGVPGVPGVPGLPSPSGSAGGSVAAAGTVRPGATAGGRLAATGADAPIVLAGAALMLLLMGGGVLVPGVLRTAGVTGSRAGRGGRSESRS